MVSICDSWQTKAEKAAERRTLSKQKKLQRDRARLNKSLAQKLLSFLQERNHSILLSASTGRSSTTDLEIHLWTDGNPTGHPFRALFATDITDNPSREKFASPYEKRSGRLRSNSCIERPPESPKITKRGRNRSNSDAGAYPSVNTKQKLRARSESFGSDTNSNRIDEEDSSLCLSLPLCVDHFFGTCTLAPLSDTWSYNPSGNHVLRCAHGLHPCHKGENPTLASILLKQQKKSASTKNAGPLLDRYSINQQALVSASSVAKTILYGGPSAPTPASAPYQMNMLYHLNSKLTMNEFHYDSDEHSSLLVDTVSKLLSINQCSVSSIVYLTINDILVFDRYQNGIVLTNLDEEFLLFGGSKRRTVSVGEYVEDDWQKSNNFKRDDLNSMEAHHQRLVQYLPGHVLEYILAFLPQAAVASFQRVCKAWHNEIWYSSQGLWSHLMERNDWPFPQKIDSSNDGASIYRETFVKHYKAVRDVNAIIRGLAHLTSESATGAIAVSQDVAIFDFKDIIGRPVSGDTVVRKWSASRVLVGSGDCTLHIYDIVDTSVGNGKRCKQSLRVIAVPFSNTKKRCCRLVGLDIDNRFVGCLYKVGSEDEPAIWFSVIERDELLGTGKGGSHLLELEDESVESHNLKSILLEHIRQNDDQVIPSFLRALLGDSRAPDVVISENFVACGNGEFLFEANLFFWPQQGDLNPTTIDEPFCFSKLFLFSSDCGNISWVSPLSFHGYMRTFTLCKIPRETSNIMESQGDNNGTKPIHSTTAQAAWLLDTFDVVKVTVHGSGNVSYTQSSSPSFDIRNPSILCLSQEETIFMEQTGGSLRLLPFFENDTNELVGTEFLGNTNFISVMPLRQDYLILFGLSTSSTIPIPALAPIEVAEVNAKLFHVPSRKVIHTTSFKHKNVPKFSFCTSYQDGLVAICVDNYGLLVAGHEVSFTTNENWDRKTKRKKGARTKGKRDYFARGMRRTMA